MANIMVGKLNFVICGYVHFVVVGVMDFCFLWLHAFDLADVISLLSG